MTRPAPRIDPRNHADLVRDTERLARLLSPWRPPADGVDLGRALIGLFADMAERVLDRLNAVPDRDFLAFLELLGVERLPARAARVPLTFSLPPGSTAVGFVPAGTPVATDGPDVARYFTQRDLVVHAATLQAAVVLEPAADRIGDMTLAATGASAVAWPAFAGDSLVEHALYVAHDGFGTLPRPRGLRITLATVDPAALGALPLQWSRWAGSRWEPIDVRASPGTGLTVDLGDVEASQPVDVGGRSARWLRARLTRAIGTVGPVPEIDGVTVAADVRTPVDQVPAAALADGVPLDPSGDGFPFGEQPRFGSAWYLGSDLFGRVGADVTVDVRLSEGAPAAQPSTDLVLAWEVGGADGWVPVGRSGPGLPAGLVAEVVDRTAALTMSGQVALTVPATGGPVARGGVTGWWLRARIVAGNYGREAHYREPTPVELGRNPQQTAVLVPATFAPPVVARVRLGWAFQREEAASAVLTVDGEAIADRAAGGSFRPFQAIADDRPALHLGFDRPFPAGPVLLHMQVEPAPYDPEAPPRSSSPLRWEYATPGGWSDLHAVDETRGLTRSGPVGFLGPADLAPTRRFGRSLCWLRVRPGEPGVPAAVRLRRILTDTVLADAAVPAANEVLGVSDAGAGQRFGTTRTPVLAGERLEVLAAGAWQPWIRVPDFAASGPADPHYTFDAGRGEVRFGDGRYGAVPPAGSAIRLTYRSGGGAAGNRPAGAVHKLEVGLAGIDRVVNPEPAAGGADAEPLERVRVRGPLALRHGGRAVAAEDYADLAVSASPDVARALTVGAPINPLDVAWIVPNPVRAVPATAASVLCHATAAEARAKREAPAGRVAVVVVPQSAAARPEPPQQLLDEVRDVLRARSPAVLGDGGLLVLGPAWVQVTVGLAVAATDLDTAQRLPGVLVPVLEEFLHPLSGGADGTGWAFGRIPHRSDLFALVDRQPGVDHVIRLDVSTDPDPTGLSGEELARTLVWSGSHTVAVVPAEGAP